MTTGEKAKRFRNLRGISQKIPGLLSGINSAIIKNMSMADIETVFNVLSLPLKMDEQHQHAIDALPKDLDAVKQSILDDTDQIYTYTGGTNGIRNYRHEQCIIAIRQMGRNTYLVLPAGDNGKNLCR